MYYHHHCPNSTCEQEMAAHHGQRVTVIRALREPEESEVGPMSHIRFADGYEGDAFADELLKPGELCSMTVGDAPCGWRAPYA